MTSSPFRVPRAHQVIRLIEFLMNFTLPSAMQALTPPGWLLLAGAEKPLSMPQPGLQLVAAVVHRILRVVGGLQEVEHREPHDALTPAVAAARE